MDLTHINALMVVGGQVPAAINCSGLWGSEMGFAAFRAAIEHPALRAVAEHWRAACGDKRMPSWGDLDPAAIKQHLPIIWSWKYDCATDTFTGRLAGETITWAFGRQLRGTALKDFFAGREYEPVLKRFKKVVDGPAFMHCTGRVFAHAGRAGRGERIALPLSDDGQRCSGIVGATIYGVEARKGQQRPDDDHYQNQDCRFYLLGGQASTLVAGRPASA